MIGRGRINDGPHSRRNGALSKLVSAPGAVLRSASPPAARELLDAVHHAVQLPLRVDLVPTAQRESAQSLVVPEVGKHRLDRAQALAVQLPSSW